MTIIEGIGDEVTHFFIALFVILIGTAAWWTTNISEQRPVRAVVWLERRRHRTHRRLTNHTESVTITEGSNNSVAVEEEERSQIEVAAESEAVVDRALDADKPPESNPENDLISSQSATSLEERSEERNIIDKMDADANIVRQRRLAFYLNNDNQGSTSSQSTLSDASSEDSKPSAPPDDEETADYVQGESSSGITIKLKYINDDSKLVEGNLNESLEEFKKRHFLPEMSSNKIVRLIFNGQVLQPDTQTLKNCGLFDNCVVHCLIHQKRAPQADPNVVESRREGYSFPNPPGLSSNNNNNNNNQNRDWDLGNFLFAFISFILLAAWYFRYVYAHLYTVTATVGLILITGIFTIVLVGMYFPDSEQSPTITFHLRERGEAQQNE